MSNWNIMLYMAGDNNLSEEMVWAQTELEKLVLNNAVISIQFDARENDIPVYRYVLGAGAGVKKSPVHISGKEYESFMADRESVGIGNREPLIPENSGSPTTLLNFIWWATKQATEGRDRQPKDLKHVLILSGHGSGSENDFLSDDTSRTSLTIPALSKVLSDARLLIFGKGKDGKIDILGMDSCLMSTAEVYYQVRESVRFLVAAEGFEPNTGWPYAEMLKKLMSRPAEYQPIDMASNIVKEYISFYKEYAIRGGQSVDLSACNVERWEKFRDSLSAFSRELVSALNSDNPQLTDAIILAHWRAQTYKSDQYVDLVDFADLLRKSPGLQGGLLAERCDDLIKTITGRKSIGNENVDDERIVLMSGYAGPAFQYSNGLSAYFPWSDDSLRYATKQNQECLFFADETGWHKFLVDYTNLTRRAEREGLELRDLMQGAMHPRHFARGRRYGIAAGNGQAHRWNAPHNKGISDFKSMKNPPNRWDECCAICPNLSEQTDPSLIGSTRTCHVKQKPAECHLAR